MPEVRGERARPRVALIGMFTEEEETKISSLFPTVWKAHDFEHLSDQVDYRELDLLVLGEGVVVHYGYHGSGQIQEYIDSAHTVSFSAQEDSRFPIDVDSISGYTKVTGWKATNAQFTVPSLPLPVHRRLMVDLQMVASIRGWQRLYLYASTNDVEHKERLEAYHQESAVLLEGSTENPLAVVYWRQESNLGVAVLPNVVFDKYEWVKLLVSLWAERDRTRLGDFGVWFESPEWMTWEEIALVEKIERLEQEKVETVRRLDMEIARLSDELTFSNLAANQGLRKLLTAQDRELVAVVGDVFKEWGFCVEDVDDSLDGSLPKREDLRLRLPELDSDWEAIVEVRGYEKSTGKTSDFQRMNRFASLYFNEKKRLPNKRLYVVNGSIEVSDPSQRPILLASAQEDIEVFAEDGGVVISTSDLFRASKLVGTVGQKVLRDSIVHCTGRWTVSSVKEGE